MSTSSRKGGREGHSSPQAASPGLPGFQPFAQIVPFLERVEDAVAGLRAQAAGQCASPHPKPLSCLFGFKAWVARLFLCLTLMGGSVGTARRTGRTGSKKYPAALIQ